MESAQRECPQETINTHLKYDITPAASLCPRILKPAPICLARDALVTLHFRTSQSQPYNQATTGIHTSKCSKWGAWGAMFV